MEYQQKGVHCQVQSTRYLRGTREVVLMRIMELLALAGYTQYIEETSEMLKIINHQFKTKCESQSPP